MMFQTYGNRNHPAVLFFHAMGVTGESSEPVANYLQDRYFCILPTVVILQGLFHGPGVTSAGRLDHCKGQRLLISGLLHSAIPPVSLVLMVSSVLVLCRWTALRDIPTTAPISLSVSSRTQCSIKMLCPGWGKLAKAAATSPSLI